MKIRYYITMLVLVLFSCNKPMKGQKINKKEYAITELEVLDKDFQKTLENIIFTSNCFKRQQYDRYIINISNSLLFKGQNLSAVRFLTYCGYDNRDLKNILGGFYVKHNGGKYLFVIEKDVNIVMRNTYFLTKKNIDIVKHMGAIEEEDADLYIEKVNGNLSLVYSLCPNLVEHKESK
jgi:hypothetical protein